VFSLFGRSDFGGRFFGFISYGGGLFLVSCSSPEEEEEDDPASSSVFFLVGASSFLEPAFALDMVLLLIFIIKLIKFLGVVREHVGF